MKNRLIVANTYYQLIVALQLRFTLFKDDMVVLLLSDHSNGTEIVAERIREKGYFTETKYIKTKFLRKKKSIPSKLFNFYENIFPNNNRYKALIAGIDKDYVFDEIISFNIGIFIYNLFAIFYEKNKKLKISGYEEGVLSYNSQLFRFNGSNLICRARRLIRKKSVADSCSKFYCFYPAIYKGGLVPTKIPGIDKSSVLIEALQSIFDIKPEDLDYPQKYIYFTSVYDFEGGDSIGEYELVQKLVKRIGKKNLLVKVHPRDSRNIYTKSDLSVDKNSSIPWEAIQLSASFTDKIYLTATSGSVLAGSFLSPKPIRTYYLFKLCNLSNNELAINSVNTIEKLLSFVGDDVNLKNVTIANTLEEV